MKRQDIVDTINSLEGQKGHEEVIKVYNAQKPLPRGYKMTMSDPWCAATVSAVFLMNGYNTFSECSCTRMIEKAKAAKLWEEKDSYKPKIGDVIMYDWDDDGKGDDKGQADHTGIVVAVTGNDFIVREGNKKKTIGNRAMKVNGKHIRGFILPPYEATTEYYTVVKGDNLTKIAKKFNTTVSKLIELNKLKDPNLIHVGDKLRVR